MREKSTFVVLVGVAKSVTAYTEQSGACGEKSVERRLLLFSWWLSLHSLPTTSKQPNHYRVSHFSFVFLLS